jgi:hypothetical protein
MELTHEFRIAAPVDEAWEVLTDVERIAPCLPGAELQEVKGEEYHGVVRVKVGPMTAQYKGMARFVERSDEEHRAVLRAEGRETRGQGNASATITAEVAAVDDGSVVSVVTDLMITGRVAQFGRGILADVSSKLLDQFVVNLEQLLHTDTTSGNGDREPPPVATAKPVDLLDAAGAPVAKRIVPFAAAAVIFLWLRRRLRRRRLRRRQGQSSS